MRQFVRSQIDIGSGVCNDQWDFLRFETNERNGKDIISFWYLRYAEFSIIIADGAIHRLPGSWVEKGYVGKFNRGFGSGVHNDSAYFTNAFLSWGLGVSALNQECYYK